MVVLSIYYLKLKVKQCSPSEYFPNQKPAGHALYESGPSGVSNHLLGWFTLNQPLASDGAVAGVVAGGVVGAVADGGVAGGGGVTGITTGWTFSSSTKR